VAVWRGGVSAEVRKEVFPFFEKKKQQAFVSPSTPGARCRVSTDVWRASNSFLVLFFKKELLSCSCCLLLLRKPSQHGA
jgi:hypothetical protein